MTNLFKTYPAPYVLLLAACIVSAQTNPSTFNNRPDDVTRLLQRQEEEMRAPSAVRATIFIDREGPNPRLSCWVGVVGHTNVIAYKPLPEQAFDANLFDKNGDEIPKALFSHKFGQPLKVDKKLRDGAYTRDLDEMYGHSRKLDFTNWDGTNHYWDFDVVSSFRIQEPGQYTLQVQVKLFVKGTNGIFQPFILPPVKKQVTVSEGELR